MGCFESQDSDKVSPAEGGDENNKKYGEKREFDPNFKGPIKNRSCTDIICCLIFTIFILGQSITTYFAFKYGNPLLLVYPTDSNKKICGHAEMSERPYLFYFDLIQCARMGPAALLSLGCPTNKICVKKCPTINWAWLELQASETSSGTNDAVARNTYLKCKDGINASIYPYYDMQVYELTSRQYCAPYYLESTDIAKRCIPKVLMQALKESSTFVSQNGQTLIASADNTTLTGKLLKEGGVVYQISTIAERVLKDIINSWYVIVAAIVLSMFVSLIWIVLLRFIAGCIVWGTLIIFTLGFVAADAYCFYQYWYVVTQSTNGTVMFYQNINDYSSYLNYRETWLAFGIVLAIFAIIFLCILIFLRSRLRLAIALIGQASKAVGSMMTTLVFPLFPFIFEIAVIGYWGILTVYLASSVSPDYAKTTSNVSDSNTTVQQCQDFTASTSTDNLDSAHCQFVKYAGSNWTIYLQLYNLFVSLWILNFVIGFGQCTLAGAFASWYWAWEKPKDVPTFPIFSSLLRVIRYHIGSIAFGAFIIAVVQLIRIILEYIDRKVKGKENPIAKFILCCLKCCFWCLEKIIKMLTKNAYIMIAIYGRNFCFSAKDAFFLIMRNIVRVVVLDKVTDFLLLLSKLVVAGGVTAFTYFFLNGTIYIPYASGYNPTLTYIYVPLILIGVGCMLIASLFFSVFEFAVDTLFLCVMEDLDRHDGSPEKPYFMSKGLMKILDVDNKFKDDSKKEGCGCCCC